MVRFAIPTQVLVVYILSVEVDGNEVQKKRKRKRNKSLLPWHAMSVHHLPLMSKWNTNQITPMYLYESSCERGDPTNGANKKVIVAIAFWFYKQRWGMGHIHTYMHTFCHGPQTPIIRHILTTPPEGIYFTS